MLSGVQNCRIRQCQRALSFDAKGIMMRPDALGAATAKAGITGERCA
jgi:hypothetical protein